MSLATLFDKTVTLERLSPVASTKKETFQAVVGNISCAIHPVEGTQQEMLEGGLYNTFKMFCDDSTDIRIGDRVLEGSNTYTVKGLKTYDMGTDSSMKHKSIVLVKGV